MSEQSFDRGSGEADRSGGALPGKEEEQGHQADEDRRQERGANDVPGLDVHADLPCIQPENGQPVPYRMATIVLPPSGATVTLT